VCLIRYNCQNELQFVGCWQGSVVSTVTRLSAGQFRFKSESWQRQEIYIFSKTCRLALRLMQPPVQWVLGSLSLWVKWPVCEAINSPLSNAKVKNDWCQLPPLCALMACIGDSFILTFTEAREVDPRQM
jgi:hypothetical protein